MEQQTAVDSTVTPDLGKTTAPPPTDDVVAKAELDHALGDLNKTKNRARELEEENKRLKEAQLKATNDWKTIAEQRENELLELKGQYGKLSEGVVLDKKLTAVREEALKAGILNESLKDIEMLSWDDVQIETTSTGRINVLGADKAIAKLKMLRPHWFSKPGAPKVNSSTPNVTVTPGEKVTYKQVEEAEKLAKKSGDYTNYRELLIKFKQQQ